MKAIILATTLLTNTLVFAEEDGKELHAEACVECHIATHDEAFYTRDNSKMATLFDLRRQVSMCVTNFELGWFPEEEKAVLDYLNNQYYHLKE